MIQTLAQTEGNEPFFSVEVINDKIKWLDHLIDQLESEKILLPAKVHEDGTIQNATLGTIEVTGAKRYKKYDQKARRTVVTGESNFPKQQEPVEPGMQDNGTTLGTHIMNMHYRINKARTQNGRVSLQDNPDAKILRYSQQIHKYKIDKGLADFIQAAKEARTQLYEMKERALQNQIVMSAG